MREEEAHLVVDYFLSADAQALGRMGIDPAKLLDAATWTARIRDDLARPLGERRWHFVVWEIDGTPIGHSNIGDIEAKKHGTMHLHIWHAAERARGHGRALVLESVRRYFEVLDLRVVYCQPNALNVAPNRALFRAGFEYLETYETVPGWLNYHQSVTRWAMTRERLVIAALDRLPALLYEVARGLSSEQVRARDGEAFAFVEHAWHLADLEEEGFGVRIARLLREDAPQLPDFDGGRIARERRYIERDAAEALARFAAARAANVSALRGVSGGAWERWGTQGASGA